MAIMKFKYAYLCAFVLALLLTLSSRNPAGAEVIRQFNADIKQNIDNYLMSIEPKNVSMVGAKFIKFCGKYDLERMGQNAQGVAEILSQKLPKELV